MSTREISIDMDARCSRCRAKGATQCGLCLACITKDIVAGRHDAVMKGRNIVDAAVNAVEAKP